MKKLNLILLLSVLPFCGIYAAPEVTQETAQLLIPKLNSDRIAHFFGSYGVETIPMTSSPFGECRVANLYSKDGEDKIMRTLAIVDFKQPVHESLQQVHKDIIAGKSVGIALRDDGWKIDKVPVYFGSVDLSPALKAWMHENKDDRAAVHIYQLNVSKESSKEQLHYCTIIEVHSPQYLDEKWLQALYADQFADHQGSTKEVDGLISSLNTLILQLPK